jgi:hypothetical protein
MTQFKKFRCIRQRLGGNDSLEKYAHDGNINQTDKKPFFVESQQFAINIIGF